PQERALAESALAEARAARSFNIEPVRKAFDELSAKARSERPFRTFIIVPLRRLASTWVNLAAYAKSSAARIVWVLLLLAASAAAGWGRAVRSALGPLFRAPVTAGPPPPASFAAAVEPRIVVEALPAVFTFAGFFFQAAWEWKYPNAAAA